ncbi:GlcG/HbpS family heme-binding protein [Pseudorhodoplanes sp.]|uniref:GlcG/HbpS family heme-binding protein n=1 Tax=Pseudorhodoplanes sp. TaxID=1934341 RepID=UPI00391D8ABA
MRQKPCLQSSDVHTMAAACRAEAEKHKWNVTIAIVDDAGVLLYLDRMDGAASTTAEVAAMKAKTSAITRRPSKFWEDRIKDRPAFMNFPGVLQIQGGLPIMHEGECVGAIGVSGVQSHEDEQIAKAGIDALA